MTKELLIEQLIQEGYLKTPEIIEAFRKVDRAKFVPEHLKAEAYVNAPLSIGKGQTISQPATVAFMLELLQLKKGDKILDVGFGSGWQTALLAEIVGENGKILSVEIVPEVFEFGKKNVEQFGFQNVHFFLGNALVIIDGESPFDKIIAAAAGHEIPKVWKDQLKINGRLVLPVYNSLWLVIKRGENKFEEEEFPGFVFVPLIEPRNMKHET